MRLLAWISALTLFITAVVTAAVGISRAQPRESLLVYQSLTSGDTLLLHVHALSRNRHLSLGHVLYTPYDEDVVSVSGGRLAFARWISDDRDIFLWDGESPPYNITCHAFSDYLPAIAPDGRVAFVSVRNEQPELFVWSAQDPSLRQLGPYRAPVLWSVQGRLVFRNADSQMVIVEPDNTVHTMNPVITYSLSRWAWSPDGRLAYDHFESGAFSTEIMIMGADRRVNRIGTALIRDGSTWSEDGQLALIMEEEGNTDVYVWSEENGFTNVSRDAGGNYMPAWSRDGRLAFVSERDVDWEIYVQQPDGTQINISNSPGYDFSPVWSADGRLAFISDRDGNQEIYVWSAEEGLHNVTHTPYTDESDPMWLDPPRP